MFEHHKEPLLPRVAFFGRVLRMAGAACVLIVTALGIGTLGYHTFEGLPWIDAVLNAAMILSGMGQIDPIQTTAGKVFATGYALFSGVVFLTSVAIFVAPIFHRMMHHFHLDLDQNGS